MTYWPPRDGQASSVQGWVGVGGRVGKTRQPTLGLWAAGRKMKARSYGKALGPDGRRPVGKGGLLNPGCRDSVTPSFITIRSLLLLRTKPPNSGWLIPQTSPQSPVLRSSYSSFNGFGRGRRTSWTVAAAMGINPLLPLGRDDFYKIFRPTNF